MVVVRLCACSFVHFSCVCVVGTVSCAVLSSSLSLVSSSLCVVCRCVSFSAHVRCEILGLSEKNELP